MLDSELGVDDYVRNSASIFCAILIALRPYSFRFSFSTLDHNCQRMQLLFATELHMNCINFAVVSRPGVDDDGKIARIYQSNVVERLHSTGVKSQPKNVSQIDCGRRRLNTRK